MSEQREWKANSFHRRFIKEFLEKSAGRKVDRNTFKRAFEDAGRDLASEFFSEISQRIPSMVVEHREFEDGFRQRNLSRWQEGFSFLRALVVVSEESAQAARDGMMEKGKLAKSAKLFAITTLHARALRVAREIICLLENGFADGAIARWRSLHEYAVISIFLLRSDEGTAERFLASRACADSKAAKQQVEYHRRANLPAVTEDELEMLENVCGQFIQRYGKELKKPYGWAFGVLRKQNLTLFDLEKYTGLDHWRPRVRWASQEIHGNFTPPDVGLGVSESKTPVHQVGRSNSGMTDPGHMCAVSLLLVTSSILMIEPTLDRIALLLTLEKLAEKVGDSLLSVDRPDGQEGE